MAMMISVIACVTHATVLHSWMYYGYATVACLPVAYSVRTLSSVRGITKSSQVHHYFVSWNILPSMSDDPCVALVLWCDMCVSFTTTSWCFWLTSFLSGEHVAYFAAFSCVSGKGPLSLFYSLLLCSTFSFWPSLGTLWGESESRAWYVDSERSISSSLLAVLSLVKLTVHGGPKRPSGHQGMSRCSRRAVRLWLTDCMCEFKFA